MNERIQKFILQATVTNDVYNPDTGITHYREFFDHEKFAELIVWECMDVVAKKCASPTAYNALVEHFGVMNNIKAGADINAGDGGYSESTRERYEEAVKGRKVVL